MTSSDARSAHKPRHATTSPPTSVITTPDISHPVTRTHTTITPPSSPRTGHIPCNIEWFQAVVWCADA